MIVLDTHIWVWWVHGDAQLTETQADQIAAHESDLIGVSTISCWEVCKLVEYGRLALPCDLADWFRQALSYPGVQLLGLSPEIARVNAPAWRFSSRSCRPDHCRYRTRARMPAGHVG